MIRRTHIGVVFTGALAAFLWSTGAAPDAQSPSRTIGPADCTAAESPAWKNASLEYMGRVLKSETRPASVRSHDPHKAAGDADDDVAFLAEEADEGPRDAPREANGTPFA